MCPYTVYTAFVNGAYRPWAYASRLYHATSASGGINSRGIDPVPTLDHAVELTSRFMRTDGQWQPHDWFRQADTALGIMDIELLMMRELPVGPDITYYQAWAICKRLYPKILDGSDPVVTPDRLILIIRGFLNPVHELYDIQCDYGDMSDMWYERKLFLQDELKNLAEKLDREREKERSLRALAVDRLDAITRFFRLPPVVDALLKRVREILAPDPRHQISFAPTGWGISTHTGLGIVDMYSHFGLLDGGDFGGEPRFRRSAEDATPPPPSKEIEICATLCDDAHRAPSFEAPERRRRLISAPESSSGAGSTASPDTTSQTPSPAMASDLPWYSQGTLAERFTYLHRRDGQASFHDRQNPVEGYINFINRGDSHIFRQRYSTESNDLNDPSFKDLPLDERLGFITADWIWNFKFCKDWRSEEDSVTESQRPAPVMASGPPWHADFERFRFLELLGSPISDSELRGILTSDPPIYSPFLISCYNVGNEIAVETGAVFQSNRKRKKRPR